MDLHKFSLYKIIIYTDCYHSAEQSKLTRSHLWGLKLKESAYWTPAIKCRYSGHTNAAPAILFKTVMAIDHSFQSIWNYNYVNDMAHAIRDGISLDLGFANLVRTFRIHYVCQNKLKRFCKYKNTIPSKQRCFWDRTLHFFGKQIVLIYSLQFFT